MKFGRSEDYKKNERLFSKATEVADKEKYLKEMIKAAKADKDWTGLDEAWSMARGLNLKPVMVEALKAMKEHGICTTKKQADELYTRAKNMGADCDAALKSALLELTEADHLAKRFHM